MIIRTAAIAMAILIAGCSKSPTDTSSSTTNKQAPAPAASTDARIAAVSDPRLRVEPAELGTCDDQVVRVTWDFSTEPNNGSMEIWVGPENDRKIFTAGGNVGDVQTGAWTRPGTEFELRRTGQNAGVARAIVGGPRCD